jgi:hypothetical protein
MHYLALDDAAVESEFARFYFTVIAGLEKEVTALPSWAAEVHALTMTLYRPPTTVPRAFFPSHEFCFV